MSIRDSLYDLKQRGTVVEYVAKFSEIVANMSDGTEVEKIWFFQSGLKGDVRNYTRAFARKETLDSYMQAAEQFIGCGYSRPQYTSTPMEMDAAEKTGYGYMPRFRGKCHQCGV
ncbi:hypothetical protein GGI12_004585 [Dipsacomyces acuminosporus]|nr:hypothetical protein GGI12_004585 [Dipsacomyces acuminosporus]